jgi:hypothetical protein
MADIGSVFSCLFIAVLDVYRSPVFFSRKLGFLVVFLATIRNYALHHGLVVCWDSGNTTGQAWDHGLVVCWEYDPLGGWYWDEEQEALILLQIQEFAELA